MYDFILAEKALGNNENFDPKDLTRTSFSGGGYEQYKLTYVKPIQIWYNQQERRVKVTGSIPYFWLGHNFAMSLRDFESAIKLIGATIGVNLFDAVISNFEYGVTIEVKLLTKIILTNHLTIGKVKPNTRGECKFFPTEASNYLKIYDASKNYKIKVSKDIRMHKMLEAGMNPQANYIRIENHYKNPSRKFGQHIKVRDLMTPEFLRRCKKDLFKTYKRVKILSSIEIPDTKKKLSATNIALIAIKKVLMENGLDVDLEHLLCEIIEPMDVLSPDDKKARKRTFRKALGQIKGNVIEPHDLSLPLIRGIVRERY